MLLVLLTACRKSEVIQLRAIVPTTGVYLFPKIASIRNGQWWIAA
jgi:hypothetical protein